MELIAHMMPDKLAVEPVRIRAKTAIIMPEGRSMHRARIGRVLSSGHKAFWPDELVIYRLGNEEKYELQGRMLFMIPASDVLCLANPGKDEIVEPVFEPSDEYGKDRGWYDGR
jgi:hypothetical protein